MTLLALQVAGVPDIHVEEALWTVGRHPRPTRVDPRRRTGECRAMDDPLALDPETMRATGYRMVDLLVERVAGVRERPALHARLAGRDARAAARAGARGRRRTSTALLATLERDVLALHEPRRPPRATSRSSPARARGRARSATSSPAR